MSRIIKLNVDVTKIDKSKLFQGKKGLYCGMALIPTPTSEYGDFMIVQDVTKEEREAGLKGAILGNGKFAGERPKDAGLSRQQQEEPSAPAPSDPDEVPF